MVTLPVYDNRAGFGDGSSTFRLKSDAGFEELGNSISRFGNAAGDAYIQGEKADLTIQKVEEDEAKRAAGIDDALTRNEFVNGWQKKYAKLAENMPPSGEGFTAAVEQAYDEHAAEFRDRFSGLREKENGMLLAQYRTQQIGRAIDLETTTRRNTTKALAENDFKGFMAITNEAGPAAYQTAMTQADLKAKSLNLQPHQYDAYMRDAQRFAETGMIAWKLKHDPQSIVKASEGVFAGFTVSNAPDEVQKAARGVAAAGGDLRTVLAIGHLESKFDASSRPLNPDGTPMSSAGGVFQTLDGAYGLGKEKGTEAQARALSAYLNQSKDKLEGLGIQATPGRLYMFHNVGDGLALNILKARPDEKMADIVARTYPSRPELAAKVLANNPALYNADMTAGDVLARYETKVGGALQATAKYVTPDNTISTDEKARASFSEQFGVPVTQLGAADLKAASDQARDDLAKNGKQMFSLAMGAAIHRGEVRVDPYSREEMKHLDAFAAQTGLAEGMLKGDGQAFLEVRKSVKNAGRLAAPYAHAARELIAANDGSPQQAMAYELMASISRDDPGSWDASGMTELVKGRVKEYRALTDGQSGILTPAEAIKRINFEATADGKASIKAVRDIFKQTKSEEVKALDVNDALGAISKGYFRNGALFDPESSTGDVQKAVLRRNYETAYVGYREQGKDAEAAKKMALQDITEHYGVSNVFRGPIERGEITRFPVESRYPPIDKDAPHKWIEQQGQNRVVDYFKSKNPDYEDTWAGVGVEIRLLPTDQTRSDFATGRPPAYALAFRNPKTGLLEVVEQSWRPNQEDAQKAFDEDFLKKSEAARAAKTPTWSATGPANYKLPSLWKVK